MKMLPIEGVAKLRLSRFLSDFAEVWRLMQIHILLKVGDLHQTPKIGKITQKSAEPEFCNSLLTKNLNCTKKDCSL